MHLTRKPAQSWAAKMEEATRPFQVTDKLQALGAMCNVLVKQNRLFSSEHPLSREQKASINRQFKLFKNESLKQLERKEPLFDCAKQYYCCCHSWLIAASDSWGLVDYKLYLEGRWVSNQLLEYMKYEGARRLQYLIDHPRVGIDAYSFFRETEIVSKCSSMEADELSLDPDMQDWLKAVYWELYNPQDPAGIIEEASLDANLSFGEGFLAVEKYDGQYIKAILKEKQRLMAKKEKGLLTRSDKSDLEFLDSTLQDALGMGKRKLGYIPQRKRIFKKPENNRAYACIKMSINRAISVFPENSREREILDRNLSFYNGKFYWGKPRDRSRPA